MKRPYFKYYLAASVSLATFLVYFASLQNEFVEWDDSQYVFENLHIRAFNLDFFRWAFFDFYAANWHPLTWISHALDYALWGLNPLGHHLTNNILHAVNTFLVVLLVVRLIEAVLGKQPSSSQAVEWPKGRVVEWSSGTTQLLNYSTSSQFTLIAAGVTGLLFGLHPIHVESVAWVAERKDLLCGLFYLLSILKYMSYRTYKTYTAYLLSLTFFTLALLSKPMAVSLPAVLLILDWHPFGRITSLKTFRTAFIEKLPFIALSIASSVITILAQKAAVSVVAIETIPLSTRMIVAANSLIAYLWKMIVPLHLVPYYPYPNDASLFSIEYLSGIILVVVLTAVSVVMVKKQKLLLSVWVYYVVTLLPVLGLVQVGGQSMADRYTYLPGIGLFLMIGIVVAQVSEKMNSLTRHSLIAGLFGLTAATISFLYLTTLTYKQIDVWRDTFSLWTYVIEKVPDRVPIAYNNRGLAFYSKGQPDRAIEDFNKAIILDPVSSKAYLNRGAVFVSKGQLARAAADFDKATELNPSSSEAYNARGSLFGMYGSYDKAIEQFSKAIELNPNYSAAYGNRGAAYSLMGQNRRALEDLDKAIQLDRYYTENYLYRGNVYVAMGNKELAISDFRWACDLGNKSGCGSLQASGIAPMAPGK